MKQAERRNEAEKMSPSVDKEDVENAKAKKMELAGKIRLDLTSKFRYNAYVFSQNNQLCVFFFSPSLILGFICFPLFPLIDLREQISLIDGRLELNQAKLREWLYYKVILT